VHDHCWLKLGDDTRNSVVVSRASELEVGASHPPPWRLKVEASYRLYLVAAFKRTSDASADR
jgi:hypothetical protein